MKRITNFQRAFNILELANDYGFDFDFNDFNTSIGEIVQNAEDFILENIPATEEEIDIDGHTQAYDWNDRMGFHFECVGESFNWADYEHGDKIYLEKVVNSLGHPVQLYTIK